MSRAGISISPNRPLYRIPYRQRYVYAYNDEEREDIIAQRGRPTGQIQRYKGLGEMTAEQLWDTTMNPETRQLLRVAVDDSLAAAQTIDTLLGPDVAPRRHFILTHAKRRAEPRYHRVIEAHALMSMPPSSL